MTKNEVVFDDLDQMNFPIAQQASVRSSGDTVVLTFQILVAPDRVDQVRIAVPSNQALDLAVVIAHIAGSADKNAR